MRKQLTHAILACLLMLTISACTNAQEHGTAPPPPPPPPPPSPEFSIATYNVHNFFD